MREATMTRRPVGATVYQHFDVLQLPRLPRILRVQFETPVAGCARTLAFPLSLVKRLSSPVPHCGMERLGRASSTKRGLE